MEQPSTPLGGTSDELLVDHHKIDGTAILNATAKRPVGYAGLEAVDGTTSRTKKERIRA
jgi:hypothetical protein